MPLYVNNNHKNHSDSELLQIFKRQDDDNYMYNSNNDDDDDDDEELDGVSGGAGGGGGGVSDRGDHINIDVDKNLDIKTILNTTATNEQQQQQQQEKENSIIKKKKFLARKSQHLTDIDINNILLLKKNDINNNNLNSMNNMNMNKTDNSSSMRSIIDKKIDQLDKKLRLLNTTTTTTTTSTTITGNKVSNNRIMNLVDDRSNSENSGDDSDSVSDDACEIVANSSSESSSCQNDSPVFFHLKTPTTQQTINSTTFFPQQSDEFNLVPKKSCLIITNDLNCSISTATSTATLIKRHSMQESGSYAAPCGVSNKTKKRVSFADVHGKDLFSVKTIHEPCYLAPILRSRSVDYFLNREYFYNSISIHSTSASTEIFQLPHSSDQKTNSSSSPQHMLNKTTTTTTTSNIRNTLIIYSLNFEQPAGDYLNFKEKLSKNFVSLENVILNRSHVNGTIKVKNLCFKKNVFVRLTIDSWKTYVDYPATYVVNLFSSNSTMLTAATIIDTFKFEFELPYSVTKFDCDDKNKINITINEESKIKIDGCSNDTINNSSKNNQNNYDIQFCVCFESQSGSSYWDNNNGCNYSIIKYLINLNREFTNGNTDNNDYVNSKKSASMSPLSPHANYIEQLLQEQQLNTIIDKFVYNCINMNNNNNNKVKSNGSSMQDASCPNDSILFDAIYT